MKKFVDRTYNTFCRDYTSALNYLYLNENFVGVLEDRDEVSKVLASGHAYLAIQDGN